MKDEKKSKAKSGLKVVVGEIMEKLKKYEESYGQEKQMKAEKEQKFDVYNKEMQELDERLSALGDIVEAFDDICKYCSNCYQRLVLITVWWTWMAAAKIPSC